MAKKLPVFFSEGEAEQLLKACATMRERAILMLFLYAGLRCNELAMLCIPDLDLKRKSIFVRFGKGGKQRVVAMMRLMVNPLRGFLGARIHHDEGPVFPSRQGGGPLTTRALRYLIKRVAKRAGFKGEALRRAHCHTFRHECFTRMLRAGADIRIIMDTAGHAHLSSVQQYLASDPERCRAAIDAPYE